jgi:hypothetical protein
MASLKDLPRSEFGANFGVQAKDLDTTFALPGTAIAQAQITPDQMGLTVWNATGSGLTAGQLVYVSGWNGTHAMPQVSLAAATNQALAAEWVVTAPISNGASGLVGRHFSLGSLNTNAATVGDLVYLDVTAGGYTVTTPPTGATANLYQTIGRVAVKSATVGVIDFDLVSGMVPRLLYRANAHLPTIGTAAGAYVGYASVGVPGTIVGGRAVFTTSLAINGTNYVTLTAVNLSNSSVSLLAASPANSTFTGGAAITADTAYPLTLIGTAANLIVAQGDLIKVAATVTGTLGGAITGLNLVSFPIIPS